MSKCTVCGTEEICVFVDYYCPNTDNHQKPAALPAPVPAPWTREYMGTWQQKVDEAEQKTIDNVYRAIWAQKPKPITWTFPTSYATMTISGAEIEKAREDTGAFFRACEEVNRAIRDQETVTFRELPWFPPLSGSGLGHWQVA